MQEKIFFLKKDGFVVGEKKSETNIVHNVLFLADFKNGYSYEAERFIGLCVQRGK